VAAEGAKTQVANTDVVLYHVLSLVLMSRLHHGDELMARHLLSNVIFNVDFLWQVLSRSLSPRQSS